MSRVKSIEEAALAVVRRLRDHGQAALWAGGCVRDRLLGLPPTDIDVATDAPPQRVAEIFSSTRMVGAKFGVVLVRQGRHWIETATFRTDLSYTDGRRPEGVVFSTPEEDAQRRDFTINGLFYDPIDERVIDYVGGQADLKARVIRAIGEPDRRFAEDHLRLLRAVRFATRFGFDIEPETAAAIRSHAPQLSRISAERIREELDKMLSRGGRARAIELIVALGLLPYLWPGAEKEWARGRGGAGETTASGLSLAMRKALQRLDALPERAGFVLAMAALLLEVVGTIEPRETVPTIAGGERLSRDLVRAARNAGGARLVEIGRALRCSNIQIADMSWLVASERLLHDVGALSLATFKRLLGHHRWADLLGLHAAALVADEKPLTSYDAALARAASIPPEAIAPEPLVTGEDLLAMGIQPGPRYKAILDEIYDAQLNEECRDRAGALERLGVLVRAISG